jgi:hypothetical protein
MATGTLEAPPTPSALKKPRKPPTPKALQERKLTLATAIEQFERCDDAIEGLEPLRDRAKAFILDHAERTGRRTYVDRIAVKRTGGQKYLDQAAAKARLTELGERVEDFIKRGRRGWTLERLK